MGKPLPQSKRDTIETPIWEGVPHFMIVEEMNVSIPTVKLYSSNLKNYDVALPPSVSLRGHPSLLMREMIEIKIFQAGLDPLLFVIIVILCRL